jgi:predicted GNAT superfamily acetyltransferase
VGAMTADIAELSGLDDLHALARLFADVWERTGEPPISSDILKALVLSGNYVSGAKLNGRLVGGLVGWLGGTPPRELHLHSHILGVVSGSDARGIGFELKQHQRRWCLERGVMTIEWTTDPLVRRNAYFNLTKLGAHAGRYLVNVYGEMSDGLNAGEESDRLLITWRLDSPAAESGAAGRPVDIDVEQLLREGAVAVLAVGPGGEPEGRRASAPVLLCQVPEDIVVIRHSDPGLARQWRLQLRAAMTEAFAAGHAVIGATRSGWYVLRR